MFLERVGKICFYQLRPSFFYSLILLPVILSILYLFFQSVELFELQSNFNQSLEKGRVALERKALHDRFLKRYNHADPYFLDQQIESLLFLENESKEIRSLIQHPAVARVNLLEERLQFLLGEENRISFIEQNIRTSQNVKETEEKQRHPVQVDQKDLQKLLAILEDLNLGEHTPPDQTPQILIQNFHLQRQTTSLETEVFSLEMSLLKREFSQ